MQEKRGRRLILADGTRLENSTAGYAEGFLWCYVHEMSMPETAALFFDPAKTATITFEYGEMTDVYHGMTQCRVIGEDMEGVVSVCLAKGVEAVG